MSINGHFAAGLFHADNMALLDPSLKGLQSLLDMCTAYCIDFDICLSANKSRVL